MTATAKVIPLRRHYPKLDDDEETARPFRLWDPGKNELVRWRWYKYARNAHLGALIEVRWAKVGAVLEVIDITTGSLLGQYKRTVHSVDFTDIKKLNEGKIDA